MDCLPAEISDRRFYVAGKRGAEIEIAKRLRDSPPPAQRSRSSPTR